MTNSNQTPPSSAQSVEGLCERLKAINRNYELAGGIHVAVTQADALLRTQAAQLLEKDAEIERLRHDLAGHMQNEGDCYADAVALAARVAQLETIVDLARELVTTGMVNRGVDRGLVVIERADKSDPHYRLCDAIEALDKKRLAWPGRPGSRAALEPK